MDPTHRSSCFLSFSTAPVERSKHPSDGNSRDSEEGAMQSSAMSREKNSTSERPDLYPADNRLSIAITYSPLRINTQATYCEDEDSK